MTTSTESPALVSLPALAYSLLYSRVTPHSLRVCNVLGRPMSSYSINVFSTCILTCHASLVTSNVLGRPMSSSSTPLSRRRAARANPPTHPPTNPLTNPLTNPPTNHILTTSHTIHTHASHVSCTHSVLTPHYLPLTTYPSLLTTHYSPAARLTDAVRGQHAGSLVR